MPKKRTRSDTRTTALLAEILAQLRARSHLSQSEVARRMGTTQTAIARLERGRQSPSLATLQSFARANGFCLEIGFLQAETEHTGCVLLIESSERNE